MARLLSSQTSSRAQELIQDIFVPDISPHEFHPSASKRDFQTYVAHHGSNYDSMWQLAALIKVVGQDPHRSIAINKPANPIYKQRAVCITVKGNAKIRAFRDRFSLQALGV